MSFTFFYKFLVPNSPSEKERRGPLLLEGKPDPSPPYARNWLQSELAAYISDDLLADLLVSHFHISASSAPIQVAPDPKDVHPLEAGMVQFELPAALPCHSDARPLASIAAIECTVFRNGHLAVILRLTNASPVSARAFVSLIRHPEFADHGVQAPTLTTGPLVREAIRLVRSYEPEIAHCLSELDLEYLSLRSWRWRPYDISQPHILRRSRPYVGTLFRVAEQDLESVDRVSVLARFAIAAGRATPSFVEKFNPALQYLSEQSRNVYGPGGSIVFIGRRGWAVFDAREHNPDAFRLGVVETTHFVITAFDVAQRALRSYARAVHELGGPVFQRLNIMVNCMVRGCRGRREAAGSAIWDWSERAPFGRGAPGILERGLTLISPLFSVRRRVAAGTSFLARARLVSPCEDLVCLLETHLISHTGRAAVGRCKTLTGYSELERAAREAVGNYTAFLKTSADYVALRNYRLTRAAVVIAVIALFFSIWDIVRRYFWP